MKDKVKVDYSRNFYNLKYSDRYRSFTFGSGKIKDSFRTQFHKQIIKNEKSRIICDERTFSAKDNKSKEFIFSEFYELMLENLNVKNSSELIRNINHFNKMDINWDEYYADKTLARLMKSDPDRYIDKETSVCYIYNPEYSDEQYRYDLYIKLNVTPAGTIRVMSLHWSDNEKNKIPEKVWNRKTNQYDTISKVIDYLQKRREQRDLEEEMDKFESQYIKDTITPKEEDDQMRGR